MTATPGGVDVSLGKDRDEVEPWDELQNALVMARGELAALNERLADYERRPRRQVDSRGRGDTV